MSKPQPTVLKLNDWDVNNYETFTFRKLQVSATPVATLLPLMLHAQRTITGQAAFADFERVIGLWAIELASRRRTLSRSHCGNAVH
jgi:hypothetical protein